MGTNAEILNSNLDNVEFLNIANDLDILNKLIMKKVEPSVIEAPHEVDWAIIFMFINNWRTFQVKTIKESENVYEVRINEYVFIKVLGREDRKRLWEKSFEADDNNSFNKWLGTVFDNLIGNEREKLPKTGSHVYKMLEKLDKKNSKWNSSKKLDWNKKNSDWNKENAENHEKTDFKKKPIDLKYEEKNKEKKIEINYPQIETSVEGRITRCLRFASITDAVEDRYWIPRWLLMALMAQEWRWDPTVINKRINYKYVWQGTWNYIRYSGKDWKIKYRKVKPWEKWDHIIDNNKSCDWGAWLIHMQAANAAEYWMKTLQRSTQSMVDYPHGEELEKAKNNTWNDLKLLSKLDDRFNPVMGIDASARFLMGDKKWKEAKSWDDWINAACRYAWRWLQDYGYSVLLYWTTINKTRWNALPTFKDDQINKVIKWEVPAMINWAREKTNFSIQRTKAAVSNLQPRLNWKDVSLDDYYEYLKWQWDNYWLKDYIDYDKKHPYSK